MTGAFPITGVSHTEVVFNMSALVKSATWVLLNDTWGGRQLQLHLNRGFFLLFNNTALLAVVSPWSSFFFWRGKLFFE